MPYHGPQHLQFILHAEVCARLILSIMPELSSVGYEFAPDAAPPRMIVVAKASEGELRKRAKGKAKAKAKSKTKALGQPPDSVVGHPCF